MHPKVAAGEIDPLENIGTLLLDFLQLYGISFQMEELGISVDKKGSYYGKVIFFISFWFKKKKY